MKISILALVLLVSTVSSAVTELPDAAAVPLKTIMKEMSTKLKTIAAQSTDAAKNASSEKIALELVTTVTMAKTVLPSSASDKARQDLYAKMIDDVIANANELAQAFHSNDNTKAAEILGKLSQDKKDGHAEFRK